MSLLDAAWQRADAWPVEESSIVVVTRDATYTHGDVQRRQRIASVSKPLVAHAVLIAAEEGSITLDDPVGQTGCTVRHLLAHAGGYPFEGAQPVGRPGTKRMYSNTGYEMLAQHVEQCTAMPFEEYFNEAVCVPLNMHNTALHGSAAKDVWSTISDLTQFLLELRSPRLISQQTYLQAVLPVFENLSGVVPAVGTFDPCPWGLGCEIRGHKSPHWTGTKNSASTFGHFGGIGTFLWVDPVADVACAMLAEREFDEWGLSLWPAFSDEVLSAVGR
jgi:CubicO group peptidase (beta-lactamase class C family)